MKSTSWKSILIFAMHCLLITPYADAQTKDNPLLIPELMDFTLMRCDFNTRIKDKQQIEDACKSGLNAIYTANDRVLVEQANNKGMIPLSNYTLSKYKSIVPYKNHPITTLVFARERSDGYTRNAIIDRCFVEYACDTLYGAPLWIKKLIDNSLEVRSRLISNNNKLMVTITNKSSLPYFLSIEKTGGLKTEQESIALDGKKETIVYFSANPIDQNEYLISAKVKNTRLANGEQLTYTLRIPGTPYLEGTIPENRISVIPQPSSIIPLTNEEWFTIDKQTRLIVKTPKAKEPLHFFTDRLGTVANLTLPVTKATKNAGNAIVFSLANDPELGKEGYSLRVTKQNIQIGANEPAGFFYAIQTLLQLLPCQIYSSQQEYCSAWNVPAVEIKDVPRFEYRGLHLDVGRHLYPVEFVKKYIDLLSMQKMNRFHWHLTEDQGWRIEIKKHPKLTEIGSIRKETIKNRYTAQGPLLFDNTPYGGFYTQKEIKEIVQYAKERYVTVIPEIDLPGHMLAALAVYPELGCTGGPYEVGTRWGIYEDVLCAGNEKIYPFIEDILKEVFELFPSEYVHIGGDECPKTRWKKCTKCQAKIKAENLKDEHELQSYVIRRVEKFLNDNGKKLIGWDEILEGGIAPNATLMSWRGVAAGITAAKSGHPVIMTPNTHVYLDHYQTNMDIAPLGNGRVASLEWTYSYDPVPDELTAEEASNIKGIQANVWSEYLRTPEMVEYMTYPRANAVAEIGWTPLENRNWEDYLKRLQQQFERWRYYHLKSATHYKQPVGVHEQPQPDIFPPVR